MIKWRKSSAPLLISIPYSSFLFVCLFVLVFVRFVFVDWLKSTYLLINICLAALVEERYS